MKPPGSYKLTNRPRVDEDASSDPFCRQVLGREMRTLDSLREQILGGGPDQSLRLRQIFSSPREIFRLEIEEPESKYYRTTLLDRDALEDLLACEAVRERIVEPSG
jgi:hypothetical protein